MVSKNLTVLLVCLVACGARSALDAPSSFGDGGGGGGNSDAATALTRVLLFGGATDRLPQFGYLADTWTWSVAGWDQSASAPPARIVTAMARLGDRVVMFGGEDARGKYLDDTWEWDGAWHERAVAGPSARGEHAMVTFGDVIVLEGGKNGGALRDTWKWDGTAWTNMNANGPDTAIGAMASIQDRIVALAEPPPNGTSDATWLFDGVAWSSLTIDGPTERTEFAMASLGTSAILFGGYGAGDLELDEYVLLGDTWEFDGATWTQRSVTGPPARCAHAMASAGGSVLLFGGLAASGIAGDTWQWQSGSWTPLEGTVPGARYAFAMAPAE